MKLWEFQITRIYLQSFFSHRAWSKIAENLQLSSKLLPKSEPQKISQKSRNFLATKLIGPPGRKWIIWIEKCSNENRNEKSFFSFPKNLKRFPLSLISSSPRIAADRRKKAFTKFTNHNQKKYCAATMNTLPLEPCLMSSIFQGNKTLKKRLLLLLHT